MRERAARDSTDQAAGAGMMAKKRQRPLDLSGLHDVLGSASAAATAQARKTAQSRPVRSAVQPERRSSAAPEAVESTPPELAPAVHVPAQLAEAPWPDFFSTPKPSPEFSAPKAPPEPRREDAAAPSVSLVLAHDPSPPTRLYLAAALAALTWAGTLVAYVVGYNRHLGAMANPLFQTAVFGALALLPAVFIGLAAFAIREGMQLAVEARRARSLADDLVLPIAAAAAQAGGAAHHIRQEIERASAAAVAAREQVAALQAALAGESELLSRAAAEVQRGASSVREMLGRERQGLTELGAALETQAQGASDTIARQTRLVAETSDLAQAHLQESKAALAARAAHLTAAAAEIGAAVQGASEAVGLQAQRLDEAGTGLSGRVELIEARLGQQRRALDVLSDNLATEQENMASRVENQRVQLTQAVSDARQGAGELGEASMLAAGLLRDLVANASEQVRALTQDVRSEQAGLGALARTVLQEVAAGAVEAQSRVQAQGRDSIDALALAAEAARTTAAAHAESARLQVEQLGEAALAVGKRADQGFEDRIAQSRAVIDQAAAMVEEAGARSAARIESGLDATRAALGELAGLLAEIDGRMTQLPDDARLRAEALRATVERGIGELTAAARRSAEETQAIDAAFQQRMRRNYEMLSEAVQLMGRAAGAVDTARPGATPPEPTFKEVDSPDTAPAPPPSTQPREETPRGSGRPIVQVLGKTTPSGPPQPFGRASVRAKEEGSVVDLPLDPAESPPAARREPEPPLDLVEEVASAPDSTETPLELVTPEPAIDAAEPEAAPALRPRLKLTPTADDETLKTIFEPSPAKAASESESAGEWERELDEWTWKDLLSSMDEEVEDEEALADQLLAEIEALGLDAGALLPQARVEEIAGRLRSGDASSARESVRRLAPAAIRRLSRRVLTDQTLREQTDRYVRRYQALLRDSAVKDEEGLMAATLLCSNPGRAFLLLDAAVGDLQ